MSKKKVNPEKKKNRKKKKGPISWMAGHSVAANLIMLILLVGGYLSMRSIKQEVFPHFEIDIVHVHVAYPGASPDEVERGIIIAIENAIISVDGITEVYSTASEGSGKVSMEVSVERDPQNVANEVKSAVDRIITFPEDIEIPRVSVVSRRRPVLGLILYGPTDNHVLHNLAEYVRDELIQHPDITLVDIEGIPPLEISIEIKQEILRRYNLSIPEVADIIRKLALDIPGGGIKSDQGEILIRVRERKDYGKQFATLPIIKTPEGSPVLLGDIATIKDTFRETDRISRFEGHPAVKLEIFREGEQTPIKVAAAVKSTIRKIKPSLPPGLKTAINRNRAERYRQRMGILLKNGAMGLFLVLVILGLFLEPRLAFWVAMGIPVSFMTAFIIMPWFGLSLNMITMFAFIVALGIVVDDAIVVGEQVYTYRQQGYKWIRAAIKGAKDVAMPVTFSIITNIVTFLPIIFIPGRMGKIWTALPILASIVFIVSLLESLFILPSHLGHRNESKKRNWMMGWLEKAQNKFSIWFKNWVQSWYGSFLRFSLKFRYIIVAIALVALILSLSYAFSGRMGFHLFPKIQSDFSQAVLILPYGTPVEKTEKLMRILLKAAQEVHKESGHPELVKNISTDIGREGSHSGRMRVHLAPPDIRNEIMTTEQFTRKWRQKVGAIPEAEILRFASDFGGPGGRGRSLTLELSHRDMDVLKKSSEELAALINTYPKVKDIDDGFQPGKIQYDIKLLEQGAMLGLSSTDIGRQLRGSFYGSEVVRQVRGRNEIKIMVRMPREDREQISTLENLMIKTPTGGYVPLSYVAKIKEGRAYTVIKRRNGRRVVTVSATVTPRSEAGIILNDLKAHYLPKLLAKHEGLTYSIEGHRADIRESLGSLKHTYSIALMIIYLLLAILFRSYLQPMVVMLAIPFGVVGAFIGHQLMGYTLSIPSIYGIVALSGVVVNDSLVMIDFANREKAKGYNHLQAASRAAVERFRPIFLTTITTFGGLFPMIFETDRAARFLIPMALSLGFGILFATFITLAIVPALYCAVGDIKHIALWFADSVDEDSENNGKEEPGKNSAPQDKSQ
ncbi:MAG: efflux RND transporter permease subunit [Deltaproteobacteria bacterium]|jgi:multidrug efflux pump subunit AcrB|nr:efflux RND transporter permease subunit [Deltaproteobacteria bacterium]